MQKIVKGLNKFLGWMDGIASISIFLIMILITADVCSRLLLNKPFAGTGEIVSMIIIIVCFLEIPYVAVRNGHVRSTMLYDKVGDKGKHIIDIISSAIGIVVYGLVIRASWKGFLNAVAIKEAEVAGSVKITTIPGRFVVIFGSLLMVLEFLSLIYQHASALKEGKPVDQDEDKGVQEI